MRFLAEKYDLDPSDLEPAHSTRPQVPRWRADKDVRRNAHRNAHGICQREAERKPGAGRESRQRTETGTLPGTGEVSIRAWHSTSNPSGPFRPPPPRRLGSRCRSARRPNCSASAGPRRTSWPTAVNSPPSGSAGASSFPSTAWPSSLAPTSVPSSVRFATVPRSPSSQDQGRTSSPSPLGVSSPSRRPSPEHRARRHASWRRVRWRTTWLQRDEAVEPICTSGRGMDVIVSVAGSGKTTALDAARAAFPVGRLHDRGNGNLGPGRPDPRLAMC